MKTFVIGLVALGAFAFLPVNAQSSDHRDDKRGGATQDRGQEQRPERQAPGHGVQTPPAGHAAMPQNKQPPDRLPGMDNRAQHNGAMSGSAMQGRPGLQEQNHRPNQPGIAPGRKQDFSPFRRNLQAEKRFHGGNYRAPQGYSAHRWTYGERLPRGYYQRDYWITNFMLFGLFAPPADLIWVRVGNDALLIDRDTGEIVQTRYGVFY